MKLVPRQWTWGNAATAGLGIEEGARVQPEVWLARLGDHKASDPLLLSVLSPDERTRRERFYQYDDQLRFVIGRGLLRLFVGAYLNIPADKVIIDYGPFGKPVLAKDRNLPTLHFNVSHSGDLVVLAFSRSHPVGVDVERERPESEWREVAAHVFSPSECRAWLRLPLAARPKAFFRAWVRKEAGVKALGVGLTDEHYSALGAHLRCFDLDLPQGYNGSVALLTTPAVAISSDGQSAHHRQ